MSALAVDEEVGAVRAPAPRIVGYDVARGLAVLGMVLVNFKTVMGAEDAGAPWLVWLTGLFDGRAAATFVVLAGVGLSLMARRGREAGDAGLLAAIRQALYRRALLLFVVGLAYTPIWPADILHFYGFYIALGAALLAVRDRLLWWGMALLVVGWVVLLGFFDYEAGWDWQTLEYSGLWTVDGMVRHLFFNGFHPVLPWAAFLLLGMWLGRQAMDDAARRRRILLWALGVALATEGVSRGLVAWLMAGPYVLSAQDIEALFGTGPMAPTPLYMLAGGATAVAAIALCIGAAQGVARWSEPLAATGQMALTLYVAHVLVGMGALEALGMLEQRSLAFACASAAVFGGCAVVASVWWSRRYGCGPLEQLMRWAAG